MANHYAVGSLVRASVFFTDLNGAATDPTTITAKYQNPAGQETSKTYVTDPEVVKDSTGRYHIDITVATAGTWYYRWNGTGAVVAAVEKSFIADSTEF